MLNLKSIHEYLFYGNLNNDSECALSLTVSLTLVTLVLIFWWIFSSVIFYTFSLSKVLLSCLLLSFLLYFSLISVSFMFIFTLAYVAFNVVQNFQVSSSCFPLVTSVYFVFFTSTWVTNLCITKVSYNAPYCIAWSYISLEYVLGTLLYFIAPFITILTHVVTCVLNVVMCRFKCHTWK